MSSSSALLFVNKNYGQYISILEGELERTQSDPEQIILHTNISAAQLGKSYSSYSWFIALCAVRICFALRIGPQSQGGEIRSGCD
jgi:hypothetical protein